MRQGDTLLFSLGDDPSGPPSRASVSAVLFTGTSRYLPDSRTDPWRELLVVETEAGAILVRDRMRVRSGEETLSQPHWSTGTEEEMVQLLLTRSRDATDIEHARLYTRALTALERWLRAEVV